MTADGTAASAATDGPLDSPPAERAPRTYLRPADAATLVVLRRDRDAVRVLMGRRSDRHVFMPGKVVFPGGRVDRADRFAPALDELDPVVEAKLMAGMTGRPSRFRARALALSALREAFEETGVLIGRAAALPRQASGPAWERFLAHGIVPSLAPLRLVARAITPPGRTRRFDARFFAVFGDHVAGRAEVAEEELLSPEWLTFEETAVQDLPRITRDVLADLRARLERDPDLRPDGPVPFHFMRHGRFVRNEI